jgi:hypothetical protein
MLGGATSVIIGPLVFLALGALVAWRAVSRDVDAVGQAVLVPAAA